MAHLKLSAARRCVAQIHREGKKPKHWGTENPDHRARFNSACGTYFFIQTSLPGEGQLPMDHLNSTGTSAFGSIDGSSGMSYEESARRTAEANDLLRTTCIGAELEISKGVAVLPSKLIAEVLFKMRTFNDFNAQNDPYQIHDFGSFDIDGRTFLFQVQSDPGNSERGSCKLMLSSEYRGEVRYPSVGEINSTQLTNVLMSESRPA